MSPSAKIGELIFERSDFDGFADLAGESVLNERFLLAGGAGDGDKIGDRDGGADAGIASREEITANTTPEKLGKRE